MKKNAGFSLIEIAIVMVILGVLVGGVVVGQSLIRNSQLQAVMSEYQQYSTAIKSFQDKYQALPGDYSGASTDCTATSSLSPAALSGTNSCRGNGNGYIEMASPFEHIAAWQHLGVSGFINGNYSGMAVTGNCANDMNIREGENVPKSKLGGAWNIAVNSIDVDYPAASATSFFPTNTAIDRPNLHALRIGGRLQDDDNVTTYECAQSQIPIFKAEEALQIDLKNDDGMVATGRIRGMFNNSPTYATCDGGAATSGSYNIAANSENCALAFILD